MRFRQKASMTWKEPASPPRADSRLRKDSSVALLLAGPLLLLCVSAALAKNDLAPTQGAQPNDGYIGSQPCAGCHSDISRKYSQTSMGRSMSQVTPAFIGNTPLPASYLNEKLNRHFEVYALEGKLYQSESGTGSGGKESFRTAHQIEWIIGAGVNGLGGIIQKDKYLFQAPLSFYTKPMNWGPSPGYEFTDMGFDRPIVTGCIFCHSGRPKPVAGTNGQFESTPFFEMAIGCENCHGPGAAHVRAMHDARIQARQGNAPVNSEIVNPARLSSYLANNICMSCHQTGDARVLKSEKTYQDFRPGSPLDETLSILMVPPTRESPPTADHVEHYYSMTLSKCYRASAGRLRCITCHDPHVQPSREEAPLYFASKCLTCHTNQSCKVPLATRMQRKPANDCTGCHMPKRDIQVISHSSATNHRIVARPDEPFPDVTFRQTTALLPDLIHLDPAPGQESVPLPLLTLLAAYGELGETRPEYVAPYLKVLDQLEQTRADDPLVQAALGRRDLKKGEFQTAAGHFRRALQSNPPAASTYADLADALAHLGQTADALPLIEKAIELEPFNPVTRKMLVVRLIETRQYAKAQEALEHYLEVFPQDDFMRAMLARAAGGSPHP
jgi:Tfp pilus assembly protein PilF